MTTFQSPLWLPFMLAALLILVKGLVIGLSRFYFVGTSTMTYNTLTPGQPQGPKWYASLNRSYINGIESFAVFAPAVLLQFCSGKEAVAWIVTLAWVYLFARALYDLVYISMGYKIWVSFIWCVGFACTLLIWISPLLGAT